MCPDARAASALVKLSRPWFTMLFPPTYFLPKSPSLYLPMISCTAALGCDSSAVEDSGWIG